MITVDCPKCDAENSALSRRCISCGAELELEGYVRCSNCLALTSESLEFCEICGTFLTSVSRSAEQADVVDKTDAAGFVDEQKTQSTAADGVRQTEKASDGNHFASPPDKVETGQDDVTSDKAGDPQVPAWLLDIDAALKVKQSAKTSRETDGSKISDLQDEPIRRMGTSDLPDQHEGYTESLNWLEGLAQQPDATAHEDREYRGEGHQRDAETTKTGAGSEDTGIPLPEDAQSKKDPGQERRREGTQPLTHMGTQPLDPEGKLLGVPQQLARADLPGWLSDQLQRSRDASAMEESEDIQLPLPPRATFVKPKAPEPEPREIKEDEPLDPSFEKWLKQLGEEPAAPEWMEEEGANLQESLVKETTTTDADTPGWLQEMHHDGGKSVELLGLPGTIEQEGRLAGIRGAIQISMAVVPTSTISYETNYSLTEEERNEIAILQGMVHSETIAPPDQIDKPKRAAPKRFLIILVAVLLLVATILAYWAWVNVLLGRNPDRGEDDSVSLYFFTEDGEIASVGPKVEPDNMNKQAGYRTCGIEVEDFFASKAIYGESDLAALQLLQYLNWPRPSCDLEVIDGLQAESKELLRL